MNMYKFKKNPNHNPPLFSSYSLSEFDSSEHEVFVRV